MFDTALLESRRGPKRRGKGGSLPLAIGLHAAIVGAFVGAAVWNTGEPPEPVIPVTFYAPAVPPKPVGDGGHAPAGPRPPHPRQSDTARVVMPRDPVAAPPTTEPPDQGGPADTELQDGGAPGDADGTIGGTGDEPSLGIGLGPGVAPVPVGGDVKAPVLVARVEPEYPEALRRARMEGIVILEAVITASGEVDQVRVLKSAGPLLDRATLEAVRQWRYKPATLNGRAVSVYLTVTVTFGLRS